MNKELMVFEGIELEILTKEDVNIEFNGEILMNGKQVAKLLGYVKTTNSISMHVDEENKILLKNSDTLKQGIRKLNNAGEIFITEDGVFDLIYNSKLPKAKEFKKKVKEIVKTIQATGKFDAIEEQLKLIEDPKERELKLAIYNLNNILKVNPDDMITTLNYSMKVQELTSYGLSKQMEVVSKTTTEIEERIKKLHVSRDGDMTAEAIAKKLNIFSLAGKPHHLFADTVARELSIYINPKDCLGYQDDYVSVRLSQIGGVEVPTLMYSQKAFVEIEKYALEKMVIEKPCSYYVKGTKAGQFKEAHLVFPNKTLNVGKATYDIYTFTL